ncbi:MAG: alpha/beta hydrolase [Clostridia bacterium]|nr:alpha/beta hydrolase [Clostridia bacterium]
MRRSTKLVIAVSATAAFVGAASYAAAKLISDVALNREEPGIMKKMKNVMSGSNPEDTLSSKTKTELKNGAEFLLSRETETPTITARDGVLLNAHWVPHPNPKRVIIAMHGWRSSWTHDFCSIASFWYNMGCSVLYPDQRGQQGSGGDYMSFGMLERFDCLDWADWVNERCGTDIPVYLAGVSMGATSVLMASELELPSNVRGVLADCGFTTPEAIWRHVAQSNLHLPYWVQRGLVDEMCRKKLNLASNSCSTLEALKKAKVPVLFIHGSDDHFVPVEMTYKNYIACASPKKLLIVPGADHGMSYLVDKKAYQNALCGFWKAYDQV